ncbi:MAG: phosphomannomutase/phosphoglucomutase [Spirochaetales bacterium]|nr:phosphomannomutase/phosphoglucomutase [Spirochaetales bacterium]
MEIFKAYDIRGTYGEEINPELAYKVGRAFARYSDGFTLIAGYDARLHSRELYNALARGIVDEGKMVHGIGLTSTPCLHFMQVHGGFDGGVMVTASHNPPRYHGFKLFDSEGGSVSLDKGLREIKNMIPSIPEDPVEQKGKFIEDITPEPYLDFLADFWEGAACGLNVVVDASNGSAGEIFGMLGKRTGINMTVINREPDGNFPNHGPNPLEEKNRTQLAEKVRELKADVGAILDGDGDRVLFVDEGGGLVQNYFISVLFAEQLLSEFPGGSIVYDLISSRVLPEEIEKLGGVPVVSRVGYTYLYDNMTSSDALFGTETSGHAYFRVSEGYYTESAAYALLLLLKTLMRRRTPLSALVEPLRKQYYQAPEINLEAEDKDAAVRRIEEHFSGLKKEYLDGVSVDGGDFWFNLRPSNTEPLLRLRLEAKDRETGEEKTKEIMGLLEG